MNEENLLPETIELLEDIGFDRNDIFPEFSFYGKRVDILIKQEENNFAIIEVKRQNWISSKISSSEFSFMPAVRQAQELAGIARTPYYGVSNGKDIVWFINSNDGLPEQVSIPRISLIKSKKANEERLVLALRSLRSLIIRQFPGEAQQIAFSILNAQIQYELGNIELKDQIINSLNLIGASYSNDEQRKNVFIEAFLLAEKCRLFSYSPYLACRCIGEVFFDKKQFDIYIPEQVAKLIIYLQNNISLRDIGDLGLADFNIASSFLQLNTYSRLISLQSYVSAPYKQLILSLSRGKIIFNEFSPIQQNSIPDSINNYFNQLIVLPPFGLKVNYYSNRFERYLTDSFEVYIDRALDMAEYNARISILLPEGFFISKRFQDIRQYLLKTISIKAIISLPTDIYYPVLSVKTSILVIENRLPNFDDKAIVTIVDSKTTSKANSFQNLCQLLSEALNNNDRAIEHGLTTIALRLLDNNNFSAFHYLQPIEIKESDVAGYSIMSLGEVVTLRKGRKIVSDPDGKVAFISQSAIKAMYIDTNALLYTKELNYDKPPVLTQLGDILINSIGPYAGKAAYISDEHTDIPISHHLFVARCNANFVLPEFLSITLNSSFVNNQILQKASGSTIKFLTTELLKQILVPIPPLHIQEEIIVKGRNLFYNVNRHKEELDRANKNLADFISLPWGEGNV